MILEYDVSCLLVLLTLLQVLKTILDLLPIAPDVQQVTLDFEMHGHVGCTENDPARCANQGLCFPLDTGYLEKGQLQG